MTDKVKKALMGLAALAALALGGSAIAGAASGGSSQPPAQEQNEPAGAPENSAGDTDNVQDENGSDDATESGNEEGDKPVGGSAAARARAAAEAKTGGKASEVEAENEQGGAYDVKVTKPDGTEVDVRLDAQFNVVGIDTDNEGDQAGEQDEAGGQNDGNEAGQATK